MVSSSNKPDFIYVGYPRTGSSWLYQQLTKHDDLFLPYSKEVDYMWGSNDHLKGIEGFEQNRIKKYWRNRVAVYRSHPAKLLNWKRVKWDLHFSFGNRSIQWYRELFRHDMLCGELTPNLITLKPREIKRLFEYNPNMKIIIGFRDPIEQLWSATMLDMRILYPEKQRNDQQLIEKEMARILRVFPRYDEAWLRWSGTFPQEHIYCSFFEESLQDPSAYYASICKFIGVTPRLAAVTKEAVNRGPRNPIPTRMRSALADKLRSSTTRFGALVDKELPASWTV